MRDSKYIAVPETDLPQPVIRIYVLANQCFKFFYHKLKTAITQHRLSCERCTNTHLKGVPPFFRNYCMHQNRYCNKDWKNREKPGFLQPNNRNVVNNYKNSWPDPVIYTAGGTSWPKVNFLLLTPSTRIGSPDKGCRSCRIALDSDQSAVSGSAFFSDSFLDRSHYSSRFGVP